MTDLNVYQTILRQEKIEYASFNDELLLEEHSPGLARLVEQQLVPGQMGLTELFDEFIGLEDDLTEVQQGKQASVTLKLVQRRLADGRRGYFNLTVSAFDKGLLLSVSDMTALGHQHQAATQKHNEVQLAYRRLARLHDQMDDLLRRLLPEDTLSLNMVDGHVGPDGYQGPASLMFADLYAFAELAGHINEERLFELFDARLNNAVKKIFEADGLVDEFVTDSVTGIFVAERAERHAWQAVKAAWEFMHALGSGGYFSFSVGIHTGPAIIGNIGTSAETKFTAVGEAVIQARNLQDVALSNQILLSHQTYQLVQDKIETELIDPEQLNRKIKVGQVYRLTGLKG